MDQDRERLGQGELTGLDDSLRTRFPCPASDEQSPRPAIAPLKATVVYNTYWRFAAERQRIFFERFKGAPGPWTDDGILIDFKFTNVYRATDRVSQYLINRVIERGDQSPVEVFFRTILFKIFNRIETWELLERKLGSVSFGDYRFAEYDRILSEAKAKGVRIYSPAYIMPSGGKNCEYPWKHQMHLRLVEKMIADDLPSKLTECCHMGDAFSLIRSFPTIGDFLAYQYVTDLNYGPLLDFSEMQFVCAGPGAKSGIRKCFSDTGGLSDAEIIRFMADRQEEEFKRLGLDFQNLWGRRMQLIDCQNVFCEVDKYSRVAHPEFSGAAGRVRIKQKFKPAQVSLPYRFPSKWKINELIPTLEKHVHHA